MKKLILKSLLFAMPFALMAAADWWIIPSEFWTFRVWESAVNTVGGPVKGPFLPFLHIKKVETGDQRLPNGPRKTVEWFTDQFGYRNRMPVNEQYDVVTIGDSNIAGSFLDQKDTLAETLARDCQCSVYNQGYQGPRDFAEFMRQRRFAKFPPKLVVYDIRSYDLYDPTGWHGVLPDQTADEDGTTVSAQEVERRRRSNDSVKQYGLNWARSALGLAVRYLPYSNLGARSQSLTNTQLVELHGAELAKILALYKARLARRGTQFVVFFITPEPALVELFRPYAADAGIDLLTFPPVSDMSAAYFQQWDSHWSEKGVRAAASVILSYMAEKGVLDALPVSNNESQNPGRAH